MNGAERKDARERPPLRKGANHQRRASAHAPWIPAFAGMTSHEASHHEPIPLYALHRARAIRFLRSCRCALRRSQDCFKLWCRRANQEMQHVRRWAGDAAHSQGMQLALIHLRAVDDLYAQPR